MRLVVCYISVLVTATLLAGCGQSGALRLPNDPNYDKRARYLLYPNTAPEQSKPSDTHQAQQSDEPVSETFAASDAEPATQPTP